MNRYLFGIVCFITLILFSCSHPISRPFSEEEDEDKHLSEYDIFADTDTTNSDNNEDFSVQDDDNPKEDSDTILADEDMSETEDNSFIPDEDIAPIPIETHAGFIEIPKHTYRLEGGDFSSDTAEIWYSFHPADDNPETKPIFIFFNGGPGAATALLFTYNTAPYTADQEFTGDQQLIKNPRSFTQFGSTLHVDARQTGFSYGIVDTPSNEGNRAAYYDPKNFNTYLDADDFIRVLLRIFKKMPALADNPVIIVGESYGGIRATAMLNLMLFYATSDNYKKDGIFFDQDLFARLDEHFSSIFPSESRKPATIAQQFIGQILIQPLLTGYGQMNLSGQIMENDPTSPVAWVEAETGKSYRPCNGRPGCYPHRQVMDFIDSNGYDIYCYKRPKNWLFDHTDVGIATLTDSSLLSKQLGMAATEINKLPATVAGTTPQKRLDGAMRYASLPTDSILRPASYSVIPPDLSLLTNIYIAYRQLHPLSTDDLSSVLGTLPEWDAYFIDLNRQITQLFYQVKTSPYDDRFGDRFLENLTFVRTLITNAAEDVVIYSPAIPEILKQYPHVIDVTYKTEQFTVTYDDATAGRISRTVTFPSYQNSCHSVPVTEPEKFFSDVLHWLSP